jgi:hypothetical protein
VVGMHPYNRAWLKPLAAGLATAAVVAAGRSLLPGGDGGALAGVALLGVAYLGTLALLGVDAEDRVVLRQLLRRAGPPSDQAAARGGAPAAVVGTAGGGERR